MRTNQVIINLANTLKKYQYSQCKKGLDHGSSLWVNLPAKFKLYFCKLTPLIKKEGLDLLRASQSDIL